MKKEISQSHCLVHVSTCLMFQTCLLVWQKWHDFIFLSYKKLFWKRLFVCKYLRCTVLICMIFQHSTRANVNTYPIPVHSPPGWAVHAKWLVTQGVNINEWSICESLLSVLKNGGWYQNVTPVLFLGAIFSDKYILLYQYSDNILSGKSQTSECLSLNYEDKVT